MDELPTIALVNGEYVAKRTGAEALTELLVTFEDEMRAAGCTTLDRLLPPAARDEIAAGLAEMGLTAPDELVSLWGWHNGVDDRGGSGSVIPAGNLWSLNRSVAELQASSRSELAATLRGATWLPNWIRLEDNRYGFSMECGDDPTATPQLKYVSEENPLVGSRSRAPVRSMCTLVTLWIEQIQQGVVTWDDTFWRFHFPKATQLQRAILLGL